MFQARYLLVLEIVTGNYNYYYVFPSSVKDIALLVNGASTKKVVLFGLFHLGIMIFEAS